jgi:hypothetical protein
VASKDREKPWQPLRLVEYDVSFYAANEAFGVGLHLRQVRRLFEVEILPFSKVLFYEGGLAALARAEDTDQRELFGELLERRQEMATDGHICNLEVQLLNCKDKKNILALARQPVVKGVG